MPNEEENNNEENTNVDDTDDNDLNVTATEDTPSETVSDMGVVDRKENSIFEARIFHENEDTRQVYGAEVVIYSRDSDKPIDKILITDLTDFEIFKELLENQEKAYVPFTLQDKTNIEIISKYLGGDDEYKAEHQDEYDRALNNWSKLQEKGDLETILDNQLPSETLTDAQKDSYRDGGYTIINATHLNGKTDADFSPLDHTHEGVYLPVRHESVIGVNGNYGHVTVVDNLTTTGTSGGEVLSANMGKKLNDDRNSLRDSIQKWDNVKVNNYITLRVNSFLRLAVCNYNRSEYTGRKNDTGKKILHSAGTIPSQYKPTSRVLTSLYRGDFVLYYDTDGSVNLWNLVKKDSINIHAQVMWHY